MELNRNQLEELLLKSPITEHELWLAARGYGLGASDSSVVLGVNPWRTPFQLYQEKIGEGTPVEDNQYMLWGRLLEPVIRQRYMDVTGRDVVVPQHIMLHPKHTFMLATLDGKAADRVVEIKNTRTSEGWGEPGSEEIPDTYLCQVTHQMSVAQVELADVAVLIGGSDFRIYTIALDRDLEKIIIEEDAKFWERVQDEDPPDPENLQDAKDRFKEAHSGLIVQASRKIVDVVDQMRELQQYKKAVSEEWDDLETKVRTHMGEGDTLCLGEHVLATCKQDKPGTRLDQKKLKNEYPEVWEACQEEKKPVRRFLLKKPGA